MSNMSSMGKMARGHAARKAEVTTASSPYKEKDSRESESKEARVGRHPANTSCWLALPVLGTHAVLLCVPRSRHVEDSLMSVQRRALETGFSAKR